MADLRAVCVFCGSSDPADPRYRDAARALGALVARRGLSLVYGGGSVGLMGELADAALGHGGRVALLDVGGFWEPLVILLDQMVGAGLLTPASRHLIRQSRSAEEALAVLAAAGPSHPQKRITAEER